MKEEMLNHSVEWTAERRQPVSGCIFFEEVIRENLDIGRPKQVQLIFDRWVTKARPGPFRTRVITDGVVPSLHIDYKGTRIKQYHKEGRALRTETTINNTYDFHAPAHRLSSQSTTAPSATYQPRLHPRRRGLSTHQPPYPGSVPARLRSPLPILKCKPSGALCSCSNCCPQVFPIEISIHTWPLYSAIPSKAYRRGK